MFSSVDVHNRLQELDIPHEIFKLAEPAGSIERAAAALGLEPGQLAKVELFRVDGESVMVIVPGDREVDISKLKKVTGGSDVSPIPNDEMSPITGYHASAVPPVGLKSEIQAYIDYNTLREDVIYTGGGEPSKILKIRSYDLVRATGGETVDVVLAPDEGNGA
jgi:prolyl-tRNA editing enzyme YbaK/EbsC (Cys-tRNA(Pro) deacylase)